MAGEFALLSDPTQLATVQDRKEHFVDVPEWGVRVRLLTPRLDRLLALDKLQLKLNADNVEDYAERVVYVIAACAVNADGEPIFTADQFSLLRERHHEVLARLFKACQEVLGPTQEGVEQAMGE